MSFYRNTVFFVKGLKEFTKGGYQSASKSFNPADLEVDLTNRSYVITGANSGLGKATALALAKKGGTVHLVCRSKERGEKAKEEIIADSRNSNVFMHQLDTSKPKDIVQFVRQFEAANNSVDVLINNAGCMINEREVTKEGFEKNFATNTLGTHILTAAMIPLLSKSSQPRVITVSSGGMYTQLLDTKDLQFKRMQPFDGTMAYAQNKRQQVVMMEQYGEQYPNIHFWSMHPGWADTPAVQSSMPSFYEKMNTRFRTPEEGADTIVWLAASDVALKQPSGLFFLDRKSQSKHLPLAWTKSTKEQEKALMVALDDLAKPFLTSS